LLTDSKEKSSELELRWKNEKNIIENIRALKNEIDKLTSQAEIEERKGDLQKVAEIRYSTIPAKRKSLEDSQETLKVFQEERGLLKEHIGPEEIATIVSRWTHIPISKMLQSEMEKLATMEDEIKKHVVGQDEAITAVSNALRRSRAGISEEKRPIGSFIFLGPTGVGKTELAKVLAQFMFDDQEALIRVDMSEYMEKHSVSKMIGSPPGYIGHDEAGQLTEKVRRRPYSAILFDEIEKAHPDVFNMLLQVLDDGHLTDAKGRRVNFKNTIIIMTSNIGSDMILKSGKNGAIGFDDENQKKDNEEHGIKKRVMEMLKEQFKPEFLNRVDEIIFFSGLSQDQIAEIVQLQIDLVAQRLSEQKHITIKVTERTKKFLAKEGYDPQYGARPLKRIIQHLILDPLAMKIVKGEVPEESHVAIDTIQDQIKIAVK